MPEALGLDSAHEGQRRKKVGIANNQDGRQHAAGGSMTFPPAADDVTHVPPGRRGHPRAVGRMEQYADQDRRPRLRVAPRLAAKDEQHHRWQVIAQQTPRRSRSGGRVCWSWLACRWFARLAGSMPSRRCGQSIGRPVPSARAVAVRADHHGVAVGLSSAAALVNPPLVKPPRRRWLPCRFVKPCRR